MRTMNAIPDQFLFINKSAHSGSLSNSNSEERFYIHSHVHSRYHKNKRQSKRIQGPRDKVPTPPVPDTSEVARFPPERRGPAEISQSPSLELEPTTKVVLDRSLQGSARLRSPISQIQIDPRSLDPFHCSIIPLDAKDQRLLQYPFTNFIQSTFAAESLSEVNSHAIFRHHESVTRRLRRCMEDELTLLTTLAYSSCCLRWASGQEDPNRPHELYVLKALEALRRRLNNSYELDSWLMVSIYSLAVCELWTGNHDAATAHLQMLRLLIQQLGGLCSLEPYLMESILLCDKYVAIAKLASPILALDWAPGLLETELLPNPTVSLKSNLLNIGEGFIEMDGTLLGQDLSLILRNILSYLQVMRTDLMAYAAYQQWLFLQHQASMFHLLALTSQTAVQECCRISLIIWLLKVTSYFGAQRWSKKLLPILKATFLQVRKHSEYIPLTLSFWITALGAMTAEYTDERDWFLEETVKSAKALDICIEKEPFRQVLQRFLFLNSEGGLQFARMVRAARELEVSQ